MKSCFNTFYVLKWDQYLQNGLWFQYKKLFLLKYSTASKILKTTQIRELFFLLILPFKKVLVTDKNVLAVLLNWNKAKMQVSVTTSKNDIKYY